MPAGARRRVRTAAALALLITCFGALLRLDALVGKYGTVSHPAWARAVTQDVAPLAIPLRPAGISWAPVERPYVGGDPINYLQFAREMRGFYQAHVREPVFLALTRGWLFALGGQDVAVSFASLTGSTLAILATYLVGAALGSRIAGLIAALLVAIEYETITWAPDGWRDDTFTAAVLLAAWALIRWQRQPSSGSALLAGALCGIACLTRITALSFALPAILWLLAASPAPRRDRTRQAAIAAGSLALVVAPYLVSCWLATGDPFYAINYHTMYYRHAEGRPIDEPVSAASYVGSKLAAHPVATIDTAFDGLFVQPFVTKWRGFVWWFEGLGPLLQWLSIAGLAILAFAAPGRLLLLLLLASLLPYMLTWNVGGGNEWRFTMHAYPIFILAAAWAAVVIARSGAALVARRQLPEGTTPRWLAYRTGAAAAVALLGALLYIVLPWFVVREAIALGESTSIETGRRDRLFYPDGWSPAHRDGITVRVSRGERSVVRFPLAGARDYDIVLRIDPVAPAAQERVAVLFNGQFAGRPALSWDPERVGTYRVRVQAGMTRAVNELTIIPETLVPAGSAGPRFAWLDPSERVGVRLWYVRVLPLP